MNYDFKEKNLPKDFAKEHYDNIKKLIQLAGAFTIIGIPTVGVSLFLKYLATHDFSHFIYLDMYSLADTTEHEFYVLLSKELGAEVSSKLSQQELLDICKERVEQLVKKYKHIVIIINRFEQLSQVFSKKFFGQLRVLRHTFNNSVTLIFSVTKPYYEVAPEAVTGGNLYFYTKYYYFKPFLERDLKALLSLQSPELTPTKEELEKALYLSGGHFQLAQLLLKTERGRVDPLRDPFIKLLLKQIYENLTYEQRKQLQKICQGKTTEIDDYLVNIGLVRAMPSSIVIPAEARIHTKKKMDPRSESGMTWSLFSPLFTHYILSQAPVKLPAKEAILFSLLKKAKGKVVSKEDIFKHVWNNPEDATDWALDSLIYRLRRNPAFKNSGYSLESYKKQGYVLVKA